LLFDLSAQAHPISDPIGSVVIDVRSGRVLYAAGANRLVYPASLTKLMTALLVFERLEQKSINLNTLLPISRYAASQPATKIYLRKGGKVEVETLLSALLVVSANDAAVVLAEGLQGTEGRFVTQMNERARQLGMRRTRFVNASGLPGSGQQTTASDMAILARTLWRRFPSRAVFYGRPALQLGKRRHANVNPFMTAFAGADGMKTGYTCAAGFHQVASATRNERRIIGVVLGASTRNARLSRAKHLMQQAFDVLTTETPDVRFQTLDELAAVAGPDANFPLADGPVAADCRAGHAERRVASWSIDVGTSAKRRTALQRASGFIKDQRTEGYRLDGARVMTVPRWTGVQLHRALITGLGQSSATKACVVYRNSGGSCVVVPPELLRVQLEDVKRIRRLRQRLK